MENSELPRKQNFGDNQERTWEFEEQERVRKERMEQDLREKRKEQEKGTRLTGRWGERAPVEKVTDTRVLLEEFATRMVKWEDGEGSNPSCWSILENRENP
jgi:hypothetical protein